MCVQSLKNETPLVFKILGVRVLGVEMVNKISYVALEVVAGTYSFASDWSRGGGDPYLRVGLEPITT